MPTLPRALSGAILAIAVAVAAPAHAGIPIIDEERGVPSLAELLEDVTPAVVNIAVKTRVAGRMNPLFKDPFFRRFFNLPDEPPPQERMSAGSGVIVDAEKGYVLTNHHVVAKASEVVVTLKDRRRFDAELIGSDPETDIALLRIDAEGLHALEFGDSDALKVGDFVVAIGNPFGLGQTVTSGIVSALGRSGLGIEGYEDFIQTDASINPGNSGGALVDLSGKLVGINTAIIGPGGGNVGIGFAVPTSMVRGVMDQLIEHGEVRRGRLGVFIQDLTPELAGALGIEGVTGAVVNQVEPDSSAEAAGLEPGDVISAVDGKDVDSSADLRNHIGLVPVGTTVELTVWRDGDKMTVRAEVGAADAALAAGEAVPQLDGATFRNLGPGMPRYGEVEGVLVADVEEGSPAWRFGLREDDIILAVNRRPVTAVSELAEAIENAPGVIALDILRGDARIYIVVQ